MTGKCSFQLPAANQSYLLQGFTSCFAHRQLPFGPTDCGRLHRDWIRSPCVRDVGSHHAVCADQGSDGLRRPSVHSVLHPSRSACYAGKECASIQTACKVRFNTDEGWQFDSFFSLLFPVPTTAEQPEEIWKKNMCVAGGAKAWIEANRTTALPRHISPEAS